MRLDEEVREIEEGLRRSKQRSSFIVKCRWATRPLDMQRAVLEEKPQIVHFSGHGVGADGIVLEDTLGRAKPVGGKALAKLFSLLADQVDCVLLNACHSQKQAAAIAKHIDTVIGMSQAAGDKAALQFAIGFYDALGNGRGYAFAHQWGCTAIELEGIDESLTPVLLQKGSVKSGPSTPSTPEPSISPPTAPGSGESSPDSPPQAAHIFISYKRDMIPDETVALELYQELGHVHDVAIDQVMMVGTKWQAWIDAQLRKADYLIVLLSDVSVRSEMVMREV